MDGAPVKSFVALAGSGFALTPRPCREGDLRKRLEKFKIMMDQFSMEDFSFSRSFQQAIEAKVKAKEDALRAQNELAKVKFEAAQRVAKARAEAEAFRMKARQLTPLMVRMEWIKAWKSGGAKVPKVIAGDKSGMFLQIPK